MLPETCADCRRPVQQTVRKQEWTGDFLNMQPVQLPYCMSFTLRLSG